MSIDFHSYLIQQHEIVDCVESLFKDADAIKRKIVVEEAFKGELVGKTGVKMR
jgi:hypothetical protein